jgi:hypothetical protein
MSQSSIGFSFDLYLFGNTNKYLNIKQIDLAAGPKRADWLVFARITGAGA